MRTFLTRVLVLTACLLLTACWGYSETYTAESIEGWVVDATSKQPIEGVVITANWQLLGNMAYPIGQLMVMESVSDGKGRFHFPAWKKEDKTGGFIRAEGPLLLVFKNGYKLEGRYNESSGLTERHGPHLKSEWNGRKIELQKLSGGVEEEFKEFMDFNSELRSKTRIQDESLCAWKSIPKTIKILVDLRTHFEAHGKKNFEGLDSGIQANEEYLSNKGCGSAKQFMENLK